MASEQITNRSVKYTDRFLYFLYFNLLDNVFEAFSRHFSHILSLGGEDAVAIGSDFDGCEINPELSGIDKIPHLHYFLSRKGLSDELLERIFFKNASNFFENILQS